MLQRDHEGELNAFALLVPGLRRQARVVCKPMIRTRIQPRLLGQGCPYISAWASARAEGHRQFAPPPVPGEVECGVGDDCVHPRPRGSTALEAAQAPPSSQ